MEKLFQILAVIFAGIAAFFWWRGDNDWLFFFAVLGAVSFFVSIRFQVGERVKQRRQEEEKTRRKGEEEINAETPELSSIVTDSEYSKTEDQRPKINL